MKTKAKNTLDSHFAAVSTNTPDLLKRSAANWRSYAAVAGSALAMSTNASASVIYQHPDLTVSAPARLQNVSGSVFAASGVITLVDALGNDLPAGALNFEFTFGIHAHLIAGQQSVQAHFRAPDTQSWQFGNNGSLFEVPAGGVIDRRGGVIGGNYFNSGSVAFPMNHTGFAGFSFRNNGHCNFGWIRLRYDLFQRNPVFGGSIEVIDLAYDNTGAAIKAGDGIVATPESGSASLAMLASGAVAVAALRRRKLAV